MKRKRTIRVTHDIRQLILQMASDNKLWGAQRIRDELLKLGIRVAKSTILRIIRRLRNCPDPKRSQRWRTFLANHASEIWTVDFFDVVTVGFKQLYGMVIFSIHTRQILHWNVTEHPTADWTYRQILQTTWDRKIPKYLLADRDSKYGFRFGEVLKKHFGIRLLRTPFRAPKANAFLERCIGSIRRECLDHFLIFGEQHLCNILKEYFPATSGDPWACTCCRGGNPSAVTIGRNPMPGCSKRFTSPLLPPSSLKFGLVFVSPLQYPCSYQRFFNLEN